MSRFVRYRAPSSSHLLDHILATPALVSAVQELPGPSLVRLIDHIGVEDAGEIVALASTEQLHEVFDEHLWRGATGEEARFSAERFALWLSVLGESGDAFVARCLSQLPVDLLTLAVSRLVLVLDMDALTLRMSGDPEQAELAEKALEGVAYEEWEEFALVARDPNTWDVTWNALLSLDRDHHELLREVIERCAWAAQAQLEDHGGLHELLSELDVLEGQVADERDERRAGRGYVSAPDARAFLELCRRPDYSQERDPITRAYFRRVTSQPQSVPQPAQQSSAHDAEGPRARAAELLQVMEDAGVTPSPSAATPAVALLPGAAKSKPPRLVEWMSQLAEHDPARHAALTEEIGYLANVLLAIAAPDDPARPVDALSAALAVCELGLQAQAPSTATGAFTELAWASGDQLFRRGVRTLCADPARARAPALAPFRHWLTGDA